MSYFKKSMSIVGSRERGTFADNLQKENYDYAVLSAFIFSVNFFIIIIYED